MDSYRGIGLAIALKLTGSKGSMVIKFIHKVLINRAIALFIYPTITYQIQLNLH